MEEREIALEGARWLAGRAVTIGSRSADAARRLSLSWGVLGVLEDGIDLPAVAVRVREPELVLEGVAAVFPLFLLGDHAARLQVAAPAADLLGGLDADAEVREGARAGGVKAGLKGKVDLRVGADELGIVGLSFFGSPKNPW